MEPTRPQSGPPSRAEPSRVAQLLAAVASASALALAVISLAPRVPDAARAPSVYPSLEDVSLEDTSLEDTSMEDTSMEGVSREDVSREDAWLEDASMQDVSRPEVNDPARARVDAYLAEVTSQLELGAARKFLTQAVRDPDGRLAAAVYLDLSRTDPDVAWSHLLAEAREDVLRAAQIASLGVGTLGAELLRVQVHRVDDRGLRGLVPVLKLELGADDFAAVAAGDTSDVAVLTDPAARIADAPRRNASQ